MKKFKVGQLVRYGYGTAVGKITRVMGTWVSVEWNADTMVGATYSMERAEEILHIQTIATRLSRGKRLMRI